MAEENFHGYFLGNLNDQPLRGSADSNDSASNTDGDLTGEHPEKTNFKRYGVPSGR